MTRVLILGSSHVGAYKNAADAFAQYHPQISLTFFGVRAPLFLTSVIDEDGLFAPPCRDEKDRAFVTQTNGADHVDTRGYDHLLLVGHRFAFNNFAQLLVQHDVLGRERRAGYRALPEALVKETVETVTRTSVAEATQAIEAYEGPATFAMAPYPAASILERGDGYALAQTMRLYWAHADAQWLFDIWRDTLRTAFTETGHSLLDQPDDLTAGPFATRPEYASEAAGLGGGALGRKDHRHMNADYGLAMLRAFAETHLGHVPQMPPHQEERIA